MKNCPQCESETGLKQPRNDDLYCEDCGWPDEVFEDVENADMNRIAWLEANQLCVGFNVATMLWEAGTDSKGFKTARKAIDAAMGRTKEME